jgi:glycine cleavage system H protein
MAVLGITTVFAEALMEPNKISLPTVGVTITQDIALGTIEGFKLAADLISPVSGQVIQVNELLNSLAHENKFMDPIIEDPYNGGWMLVVQLTKPDELKGLMSAQSYKDLIISGK